MKNEAKIYNYLENVCITVGEYYGYKLIKTPVIIKESTEDSDLTILDKNNQEIKNIASDKLKKFCYRKESSFNYLVCGINTIYQDAESISMLYRILEDLRLSDIVIRLKHVKDYDIKTLTNYLDELEVDYEVEDRLLDAGLSSLTFEIYTEIKGKEIILAGGSDDKDAIYAKILTNNVVDLLSAIFEDRELDVLTQVTIVSESEEERIVAMKLAQNLRWCEIKVDVDTNNRSRNEQLKDINSNFIVEIEESNLNKGLIKVIDNLTKEETLVDENEIIDYIVSNI